MDTRDHTSQSNNRSSALMGIATIVILFDVVYLFFYRGGIPLYHDDPDARPICFVCHQPLLNPISEDDNASKAASYGTKKSGNIYLYHHADCLPPILVSEFQTQEYEILPQVPVPGVRKGTTYAFLYAIVSTIIFLFIATLIFRAVIYYVPNTSFFQERTTHVSAKKKRGAIVFSSLIFMLANASLLTLWTQVT